MRSTTSNVPATIQDQVQEQEQSALPMVQPQLSDAERMLQSWSSKAPSFLTNLELQGEEGLVLATKASAASDAMTAQAVGRILPIKGFVLSVWDVTDPQTGEVKQLLGANLVLQSNELIGTTSPGVLRCLNMIAKSRSRGEWNPPVNCLIESHKGNQPGPYFTMRVVSKAESEALAKKKT